MNKLRRIPRVLLMALTFLLPLKFGSAACTPEMPMSYWTDPVAILIASWPVLLFPFFSAAVLAVCIICLPKPERPCRELRCYGWLWGLVILACLTGWIRSTTWDFAAQNTAHLLGLLCWALALVRALESDPGFARCLIGSLIAGLLFSVYSAFNQYLSGFEDTLNFVRKREARLGISLLDGQFGSRLKEARVSGDFSICNSYAGYLILVFPVAIAWLWNLGGKIKPQLPSRLILTLPAAGVFLFLLKETGSRGGVLGLLAGLFLLLPGSNLARKWKIMLWSLVPVAGAGFWLLLRFGRGFNSLLIRLDYFQAAFRMVLLRPFTGAGWGEFLNDYLILKNVVNDEAPHSPHNFILTLGSQCGFPALLLTTILLAAPLAAALIVLYRKYRKDRLENCALEVAYVCGLGAWTFHSMVELNYETPGSVGVAVVLSALILNHTWPDGLVPQRGKIIDSAAGRTAFLLLCGAAAGCTLVYLPQLIRAEMNYDALFCLTDPRFSASADGSRPQPAVVLDLLARCDSRSPFPSASAATYFFSLGPYHTEKALELLDQAIERTPKRSAYYFRKHQLLRLMPGRKEDAEKALLKARELSPKNPQYYPDGITPYGARSY